MHVDMHRSIAATSATETSCQLSEKLLHCIIAALCHSPTIVQLTCQHTRQVTPAAGKDSVFMVAATSAEEASEGGIDAINCGIQSFSGCSIFVHEM